jgi:alpha-amylase/alpha-mannosidase (GH57 family)
LSKAAIPNLVGLSWNLFYLKLVSPVTEKMIELTSDSVRQNSTFSSDSSSQVESGLEYSIADSVQTLSLNQIGLPINQKYGQVEQINNQSSHNLTNQAVDQTVYVTVHGHFYQPPRENPYLNAIECQDSAAPFHDWNQRISHECYRPNAFARINTADGKLLEIVNNYEYFSFNIGATLLSWLEQHDLLTYQRILEADRNSAARLNGHGNAIAQVYNHMIMPLANRRDKLTQIRWGKADFFSRFGRETEGMWLAETAVDYETLTCLVEEGIKFIILAPSQAMRCRSILSDSQTEQNNGDHHARQLPWQEVSGSQIDPTRPYRCFLPSQSGETERLYIDIFFYDGPISRDMGFGDLLSSSYNFAARLGQAVRGDRHTAQLISVATDGETFGHHKHFTEKSLAYAFRSEFPRRGWKVTNYAHYLSLESPTWEVELKSVTAWSCAHGVDRWQDDCGCGTEEGGGKWRKPLRDSLNWLRDRLAEIFEKSGEKYFKNPWAARDGYIQVLRETLRQGNQNSESVWAEFWIEFGLEFGLEFGKNRSTNNQAKIRAEALMLLEMQRHALLMFTSCGWFFEELSRPEGVQILRYAARAIELAADVSGVMLEEKFIKMLEPAPSRVPSLGNGAEVYRQLVITAKISLKQVAAHYAISSLFTSYSRSQQVYCHMIEQQDYQLQRMGSLALAIGQIQLTSAITQETVEYVFAVLHLGGYDFHCCIQSFAGRRDYEQIKQNLFQTLEQASAAVVVLKMADAFGEEYFSLSHLFAEERHRILHLLSKETLTRLDQLYAQVYRDNYGILAAFRRDRLPVPVELQVAAEITLNQRLLSELKRLEAGEQLPIAELDAVAIEAENLGCNLQRGEAAKILEDSIWRSLSKLFQDQIPNLNVNGHLSAQNSNQNSSQFSTQDSSQISNQIDQVVQINQLFQAINLAERLHLNLNLDRAQELYWHEFHRLPGESRSQIGELGEKMGIEVQSFIFKETYPKTNYGS